MSSMVALSKIVVKSNVRKFPDVEIEDMASAPLSEFPLDFQASVKELAEDINERGLINPITVKDTGGGKQFRLIAGFRRYKAVQYLGKRMIDVKSVKGKTEDEKIMQLAENIQREDLNPMDTAQALDEIRTLKGITRQADLAKLVKKSPGWVSQHLALLKASPAVKESVQSGEMGLAAARNLTSLPTDEQEQAVADAKKEASEGGKGKVSTKGARRQARKRKAKKDSKQQELPTVAEREREQREQLVTEFIGEEFGDKTIPEGAIDLVNSFWKFLFDKNRIHIIR